MPGPLGRRDAGCFLGVPSRAQKLWHERAADGSYFLTHKKTLIKVPLIPFEHLCGLLQWDIGPEPMEPGRFTNTPGETRELPCENREQNDQSGKICSRHRRQGPYSQN